FFIFSTSLPPTVIYTLSLHDALPIWVHDEAALHRGARAQPRVAALELLHDEPVGDVAEPGAAVALEGGAEDAQLAELGDQRDRRSEEHTSELQSRFDLVCRLLLEKKK